MSHRELFAASVDRRFYSASLPLPQKEHVFASVLYRQAKLDCRPQLPMRLLAKQTNIIKIVHVVERADSDSAFSEGLVGCSQMRLLHIIKINFDRS